MPNCCQGASCACRVTALEGGHITITGSGSSNDPFVFSADVAIAVADNAQFDMTLSGSGEVADPWIIGVGYATTAQLTNVPDVDAPAPTNGQVLMWNTSTSKWEAAAAPTAAPGAITTNTSLDGDGSVGDPLLVIPDASRLIQTGASGVGLSNGGMQAVVQHFATTSARTSGITSPVLNQLTMIDTAPGVVDYWDGSAWTRVEPLAQVPLSVAISELSGPYVAGMPFTHIMKHVIETVVSGGGFEALSTADLTGYAGVMNMTITEVWTGGVAHNFAILPGIGGFAGTMRGVGYLTSTGAPLATGTSVNVQVEAYVY